MSDIGGNASVEPILSPDPAQMLAHLTHLFGEATSGMIELTWSDAGDGKLKDSHWYNTGQLDDLVDKACELNRIQGQNVYIGAALRKGDMAFGRASDADYLMSTAFYVDLDDPGVADDAKPLLEHCKPTMAVVTGRRPHTRAQLWWRLEEPETDPAVHIARCKALAAHFRGDPAVFNPGRVMRLGGSVAWPRKSGRVLEMTEVIQFNDRPLSMLPGQMEKAYPDIAQQSLTVLSPDRSAITGRLNTSSLMAGVTSGQEWHNRIVRLTANMVGRGLSDDEMLAMAEHFTLPGYTHEQTRQEMATAIRGARLKWNVPNPLIEIEAALIEHPEEISAPRPASSYRGLPPEREWVVEDWIPALTVTSLYGDGGMGKTLLAQQLGTACVTGTSWLGLPALQMPVLAVLCEDDDDELHRRQTSINEACGSLMHPGLDHLMLWSRVGHSNILVNFDQKNTATITPFYTDVENRLSRMPEGPKLLILDNIADIYGGAEMARPQVNAFVKAWLGSWVKKYQVTILLLGHPSVTGMSNGSGFSGSTAWNNAVRSRLYLTRPEDGDSSARLLTRMKANYAASGTDQKIEMVWEKGFFTTSPLPSTIDRIEHKALKKEILYTLEREWNAGTPLGGSRSGRKVRDVLPGLIKTHERGPIMKAFAELERQGLITTQHGDTHKRGYKVLSHDVN